MLCGRRHGADRKIWDDGEIADRLSHAIAVSLCRQQAAELMMCIASDFGFTPASRCRISAPPPDQLPLPDLRANDEEEEPNQEDPGGWGARSISGGRWSRGPAPYHSGNFFSPSMIFGLTPASVRVAKLVAEQSDCIIQCLRFSESQVEQVRRACCSFLDHLFSHCIQPRVGGV